MAIFRYTEFMHVLWNFSIIKLTFFELPVKTFFVVVVQACNIFA